MIRAGVVLIVLMFLGCSRGPTPVADAPGSARIAVAAAIPPSQPHFGMNLASIVDWDREWAFVDVFKHSRPWIDKGPRRETLMVREVEGHYPAGRYVATWRGLGTVDIPGFDVSDIVSRKPGRIEFNVRPADGGIQLTVGGRDAVSDIHVWMPGFENAKSPFHPLFLERLAPFEVIRFMKWQRTEQSQTRTWDQRAKPDDERWSTDAGAPPEVMIDLANARHAHPWFCMPHLADDDYVRRFARLVKERLRPDLKAYVEYSNEVWNWVYPATHHADAEGKRLKLGDPNFGRYYAQRSVEVFHIWEEELGRERLVRVLASQFVNSWLTEQVLTWKDAYKHADALAVAPYFGHEFGSPEAAPAVATLTAPELLDRLAVEVDGPNKKQIEAQAALARKYGLPLIAYEGGPHLVGVGGAENNQALTALFVAANRHPRMSEILKRHYQNWFAAGGETYVTFVYVEAPGKSGSWGVLEFQDQPVADAPKYKAILDLLKK
ncbi:MAG TPA: hypothetical protein VH120_07665 [Gemmataceae bacterium]|nr:hypothetical protein [Gemmataceae bacterium]